MPPKRTTYTSANSVDRVWSLADKVRGKDPSLYRRDPTGSIIYRHSYGKDTAMGWQKDHIKPVSRGGSNDISNLQALNSHSNKSKGNSLVKPSRHSK